MEKKRKLNVQTNEDEQDSNHAVLTSAPFVIEIAGNRRCISSHETAQDMDYWKIHSAQLPHLTCTSKKLLCIPAPSVP